MSSQEDATFSEEEDNYEFVANLFAGSDEEEGEFWGFNQDDLDIANANVRGQVAMEGPEVDVSVPTDENAGWNKEDVPQYRMPFDGGVGLKVRMENSKPIDFFNLLFKFTMWQTIVDETNRYFTQQNEPVEELPQHSRARKWRMVTVDELKVFLALSIAMGLVPKQDLENYWSQREVDETPFFRKYMSKDRFLGILSHLHLVNNQLQVSSTSLHLHFIYSRFMLKHA